MKTWKKALARIVALGLTLSLAIGVGMTGALADNTVINSTTTTGTVTVTGSAADVGATINLYKIIDVNMDTTAVQPKDPVYTWVDAVATWLEGHATYSSYINAADNAVTDAYKGLTAGELNTFFEALAAAIESETVTITGISATLDVGQSLSMGQYLVVASNTGVEYNPATANLYPQWGDHDSSAETAETWYLADATVTLKSDGGVPDKTVTDADKTVAVGDTVNYRLDVAIPAYPSDATAKEFNVGDIMGEGLTWNSTSVKVYADTDKDTTNLGAELTADTHYTLVPNAVIDESDPSTTATFEVQFDYDKLKEDYSTATYVHVVYSATVNETAFVTDALGNSAYLGVNTDPYDDGTYTPGTPVEEDVYTYGITVTKVDAEDGAALLGAEFRLYMNADCTTEVKFTQNVDENGVAIPGVYTRAADQTVAGVALATNSLGQISLQGLDVGTYYLKETKAPGGYQLPDDTAAVTTITLTDDANGVANGVLDTDTTAVGTMVVGGNTTTVTENVLNFQVENEQTSFTLPVTGGMGTVAFTAGGLVIMACGAALVLFAVKKRKTEE